MNIQKTTAVIEKIFLPLFFLAAFLSFVGTMHDVDAPFHLKTGEYILEHRSIPADDPFSFYDEGMVTDRERFILSQYWAAQVIMHIIWSLAGFPGLIFFRAAVFSLFALLLWIMLRRRGYFASILLVALICFLLQSYLSDRPQYFTFLFTLILVVIIEKFRHGEISPAWLFMIPPLMAFWANLHGGFIFGVFLLAGYACAESLKLALSKTKAQHFLDPPMDRRHMLFLVLAALGGIACSYLNPSNYQMVVTLSSLTEDKWYFSQIKEYMSPLQHSRIAPDLQAAARNAVFWVIFGLVLTLTFLRMVRSRRIDITVLALLLYGSIAALDAVRYIPLFIAVAVPLTARYEFLKKRPNWPPAAKLLMIIIMVGIAFWAIKDTALHMRSNLNMGRMSYYPEKAADFLQKNDVRGRMYNTVNMGSYLLWRLYPQLKVFHDTRQLNFRATLEGNMIDFAISYEGQTFDNALAAVLARLPVKEKFGTINIDPSDMETVKRRSRPLWKRLLDEKEIDIIVHPATEFTGDLYFLVLALIEDDDWVLVHSDGTAMVFLRDVPKFRGIIERNRKSNDAVYQQIIAEGTSLVAQRFPRAQPYANLGFAWVMTGNLEKGRKMNQAALDLDENNLLAHYTAALLAVADKKAMTSTTR